MHSLPRKLTLLTAACALALTGCSSSDGDSGSGELVFAFPPGTDDPEQLAQIEPVADIVGELAGREVVTESPADYMGVVEALRQGHVDVAFLSPFATAIGQQAGGLDVGLVWEAGDEPASVLMVRADSGIETVDDVAGQQVAFVDAGSTTGHFMPRALLAEAGLEPDEDYEMTFSGGHDSGLLALQQGSVDVAATAAQLVDVFTDAGVIDPDRVVVLAESDPLPVGSAIVFSEDVDPGVREQIVAGMPDRVAENEDMALIFGGHSAVADPAPEVFAPLLEVVEAVGLSLEDIR
ncbi:phosphate/phosphite/phosphonate ABC transporter substrate-binding protein [Nocardiopsis sp. LOL_012]|uniref:phosphate/phosphite/phosphonate ABC transporter substrate-binding protein n=1 Tax=Nocardiopsis sp. LOL_012 TaxID=3345409 RepID=UPI003A84BC4A